MSKYTTEVRFICESAIGLTESKGYNDIDTIITEAIPKVFTFTFPIFDEDYRTVLEKKILKHYYTREISEETVGLWKLRLDTKLNEIMPYYNKLYNSELLEFNPLYTTNMNRTNKTNTNSERNDSENINDNTNNNKTVISNGTTDSTSKTSGIVGSTNTSETNSTGNGSNETTSTDLYSDTPQGALTGVESSTYLTNARKVNDTGTTVSSAKNDTTSNGKVESSDDSKSNTTNNQTETETTNNTYERVRDNKDTLSSTEDYLETVSGMSGTSASELLLKYRETFLNIDMMVINELEPLFFQLW